MPRLETDSEILTAAWPVFWISVINLIAFSGQNFRLSLDDWMTPFFDASLDQKKIGY